MRPKHLGQSKASAEHVVEDTRRATRRHFSAEDKVRIGLVTALRRSLVSLCHLGFECESADAPLVPRRKAKPENCI